MQPGRKQTPTESKCEAQNDNTNRQPEESAIEQPSIPDVLPDVSRVFRDDRTVFELTDVVEHVPPLNLPKAFDHRAVGIAFLVGKHVMLAMNGHPFVEIG